MGVVAKDPMTVEAPERQAHHLAWQESLERLRRSIANLEDFIVRDIAEEDGERGGLSETNPLPLSNFLALNGQPLFEAANKIGELQEVLRKLLF